MANLAWTNINFCGIALLTYTSVLLPLRFSSNPEQPLTPWFCVKELASATYGYMIASFALNIVLGLLVGRVLPSSMHRFKIDFYVGNFVNHIFTTAVEVATRRIFKTKTCQGKEWLNRRKLQQPQREPSPSSLFWKTYAKGSWKLIPMFIAGAYVHIVNQTHLFRHGLTTFPFVIITTVTKILSQAAIKLYVVKYRVQDIRSICALVGLPTVLIDTQMRIMLLSQQSSTFVATGTTAMAVAEIVIRGTTAVWLSMELQRRQTTILNCSIIVTQPHVSQIPINCVAKASVSAVNDREANARIAAERNNFEQFRQIMIRFHAAQASADMHAGYIAIGCSASIWFFYSKHPHYDLGQNPETNGGISTLASLLLIQVGVEITTDYISCALEVAAGVDFKSMDKFRLFLALIFMNHAILNVGISVLLYLV